MNQCKRGNIINIKQTVVALCFIILLIATVSFASASDMSDNMTVSEVDDQDTIKATEIQKDALGEGQKSFEQLDEEIHDGSVPEGGLIELNSSYTFSDTDTVSVGTDGIGITKDVTIDGKGYTLNASNKAFIFKIANNAHVILKNIVFSNGNATNGGAIYVEAGSTIEVINCTFQNNFASNDGGAIYMADDSLTSTSTIYDSTFTLNIAANNGGAIYTASTLNVTLSDFSYNNASNSGGSMYVGGAVHISRSTFDHESAASGGAIDLYDDEDNHSTIENSSFTNCYSSGDGGAVYIRTDNVIVENVEFAHNTAGDDGGAIYWEGGNGRIYNITCSDNRGISKDKSDNETSSTRGGTICLTGSNVTISASSFTSSAAYIDEGKNSSKVDGGALFITGNDVTLSDVTFSDCNAANEGGAVYLIGNNTKIIRCDFTDSTAKDGGALFVNGTHCELHNSTFTGNIAGDDGGAIFWEGNNGVIYNITCADNKGISYNESSSRGGTICLTGDNVTVNKSSFKSTSVSIERNSTKVDGGALFITGNDIKIIDTQFDDCKATNAGGAIYILGNNTHLMNCNYTNTQALLGGAVFISGNDAVVDDSLFRHNDAKWPNISGGSGGAIYVDGKRSVISNSDFASDSSVNYGGALSIWGSDAIIINNTFDSTTVADLCGGAIYVNGVNATISLSNFTGCNVIKEFARGGAIDISGSDAKITECNFDDCYSYFGGDIYVNGANAIIDKSNFEHGGKYNDKYSYRGGAIYVNGTNTAILKSNFTEFTSEENGGAIYVEGTNTNISESSFKECKANGPNNNNGGWGGAIFIAGEYTNIEKSNFTSCQALRTNSMGGAICIQGGADTLIKESAFDNCDAKMGGDIYVFGNRARIEDSTFDTSHANYGGAIYLQSWGAVIKDANITDCYATNNGGAIYVQGGGANIIGSSFEQCTSEGTADTNGGGAIYIFGPDTHISDSEFNNNKVTGNARGGTIFILGERTIIDGSTFNDSFANEGGVIFIEGGNAIIDSSTFANSSSNGYGGAISVHGHKATIRGSDFENITCYSNRAQSKGGAIYVEGSDTDILHSKFYNCTSRIDGGAIYINDVGTTVAYSNFTLGHSGTGGAIFISGENTTISYCNLNNNTASTAGAIKVSGDNTVISNSNLTYNFATSNGGAMDLSGKNASVYYSWFDHNGADLNGGAINWNGGHGDDSIIGTTFTDNHCNGTKMGGGAVYWTAGDGGQIGSGGLIKDSNFINNRANGHHGGAIDWFHALDSVIDNCLFLNNTANSDGGALYIGDRNGGSLNFTISNSQFYNNTAGKHGGAVTNQMTACLITNTVFDGNKARSSGGTIVMKEAGGKNSIVDHCSFYNSFCDVGDQYGQSGGTIHIGSSDSNVTISNCDFINSTCNRSFGGVISIESPDCSLINVSIQNVQTCDGQGGAIYWKGANGVINNVTIFNSSSHVISNDRHANGGAIYLEGSNCNLDNITIMDSSSNIDNPNIGKTAHGGAIFVNGADNSITNVIIDDSKTSDPRMNSHGGAIYWFGNAGSLINATISNTLSNGLGGAIYWSGGANTVENISIEYSQTNVTGSSNAADGGAIYSTGIDNLKNVYIINAIASTDSGDVKGGAIYYSGTNMDNVTVLGSRASTDDGTSYGGAVYWKNIGTGYLRNSSFESNTADLGGAVFSDRTLFIDGTSFKGNVALDGGALYARTKDVSLNNVLFELNSAKRGGAIFAEKVHFKIDGSTLRNNTAEEKGGAIYSNYNNNQGTYIRNTDVVNNTAFQGSAIYAIKLFDMTNVTLLDNQANSKEFVDKHVGVEFGRNYTSAVFVGFDNVLNAIWDEEASVSGTFNNVTYWGTTGVTVCNSRPNRSDREVGQNVTVEMFNSNGEKINEAVVVTDADGKCTYYFDAEDNEDYYFAFTHETDRYYTYLRDTLSNRSLVKIYAYTPIFYSQNQTILISLTDGAWGDLNGTVTVTVKGPFNATFEVEVVNGTYTRSNISGLPMGIYNVTAEFNGDLDHTGSSDWVLFEVLPYDDLHITKTVNITADYVNVTDIIQYNVTVTNHGPSGARGVNVTEVLSPYLKLLDNQTTKGYYNYTNGTWFIGDLDVNETVTLTIIAQVIHMGPILNAVWVYGLGNDTNLTNNNASAHNFTALPILDLRIVKDVDVEGDIINVLDMITFTITVFNDGPCNATGVFVAEAIDYNLRIISNQTTLGTYVGDTWTIGEMPNGTNATLTIVAQVIYSGNFTNAVHVYGYENETDYKNNHAEIRNITAIANVDVGITKTVNVTGYVNVTDYIQFNITIYNNGPCNATGVYVSEILDYAHLEHISNSTTRGLYDGYSWIIDTLDVGEVLNLTIIAKVINVGKFTNIVSIFTSDNDTDLSNNNASIDNVTALPIVDLEITKEVNTNATVVNVTDEIIFTITVRNKGPWRATNVTVVEVLSPHLKMTEYHAWQGEYNVTTGIWYIGDLPVDQVKLTITAKVISPGVISNAVFVNSTENDTDLTNNNDTIKNITALPIVDLGIVKEVNVTVANVTDKVLFTITVTNIGPCNATHVNVSEVLNHNLKLLSNETDYGYYNVTEGIWHIGNLTNGSTAVLTLICNVTGNDTIVNYVNVTSFEKDTYISNNTYSVTLIAYPLVDVSITKGVNVTATDYVYIGDRIKFTVTVHNAGPSNATGVFVEEFLDTHLRLVYYNATKGSYDNFTWTIGKMNNGSTEILTIVAEVISLGNISNAVVVNRTENDTDPSNDNASIDNITVVPIVDVGITKTPFYYDKVVNVGDLLQFNIDVKNYGPCDATNVTVSEVLSPLLKVTNVIVYRGSYNATTGIWYIGDLPNNGTAQLIIQARVISNGTLSNFVSVNSTELDTDLSNNNDTIDNVTIAPIVDLVIVKEVNQSAVNVTKQIKFTITVINDGPCNATLVNVSEELGNHLRFISSDATHGSYNVTESIWHIGSLTNHTNATLTIICEAVHEGNFVNHVNVTCHERDTNPYNNHTEVYYTILPIVDVSITKDANVTTLNVTNQIKFTITVHNGGPSNATDVRVTEFLDSHLSLVSFNVTTGYYLDSIWYVGDLNNGSTEMMTIIAKVESAGNFSNFVSVNSTENDTDPTNNKANVTNITALYLVDVAITKTAVIWGSESIAKVGDTIQFTINVNNYGPCDASNVTVREVLNSHLNMTSYTISGSGDYNVTTGIWYIGDLPYKGFAQLIILTEVISPGNISNFVSVNSTENDTNLTNNNDTIKNITAVPQVDLVITKDVNASVVTVNDIVQFNITVYNRGPSNATLVNVTEMLDDNFILISNSTDKGYYNRTGGYWYIGDLNVGSNAALTLVCGLKNDGIFRNYVEVSSHEEEKYRYDNWDDAFVSTSPIVDVSITKTLNTNSTTVNVGELIEFTLTVHNAGPSNATSVYVGEVILDPLHLVSNRTSRGTYSAGTWYIGDLANNETVTMTLVCEVMYEGIINNFVQVFRYENDTDPSNDKANVTNITAVVNVDVGITKTVNVTEFVNVYDYIHFNITVYNNGTFNASDVRVTEFFDYDHLQFITYNATKGNYTGDVWVIGKLAKGETANMTIYARVIAPGVFTNVVTVKSFENDTNPENNRANITNITALPTVDLVITKVVTGNVTVVNVTDSVQFIITVTNRGPCVATNVTVVEKLSELLNVTRIDVYGYGEYNATSGIWYIGELPCNGEFAQLTIDAIVNSNGTIANFVAVKSNETDRNESNNNDTIDNITALPLVDISITKEVNVTVAYVGDRVKYTIKVTNNGPSNATYVNMTDKLDNLLHFVSFDSNRTGITYNPDTGIANIGSLNAKETVVLYIIAEISGNGTIPNVVNVTSHENDTDPNNNINASDNVTALPVTNLVVVKYSNLTEAIYVNDQVRFTINVTNKGPSNATWIEITDDLLPAFGFVNATGNWTRTGNKITWTIPRLNNGTTASVDLIVRVLANGTFENVAFAKSGENQTDVGNGTNVTVNPVVNLNVTKTSNVTVVNVTGLVRFTINVTNSGPSNATWVEITDDLISEFEFVNATGNWTRNGQTVTWMIPKLNYGATASVDLIVRVLTNGTFENLAFAKSSENKTDFTNGTNITANPIVNLNVTKKVNVTVVYVGDRVKYTINVTNFGPSDATYVNVTDKLDGRLHFVSFDSNRTGITYNPDTGLAEIGNLKANESVMLYIIAEVWLAGNIPNAVNVTSHENETDPDDNNGSSKNVTGLPVTKLVVVKYSNATGAINVTDLVRFTINVTNNGPSNATWIEVTDELVPEFMFVNATGNWTRTGSKITWIIPKLNNGTTASVDLIVRVLTNGTFENIAFAKSAENQTDVGNGTNVTANPIVNLNITKTVNVTVAYVGDLVKYTINVTNHGPSPATDVVAYDKLDKDLLEFISFTPSREGITYNNITGRIDIGNLDANESVLLIIIAKIKTNGTIPNAVNVTSHENDTDPDDNHNSSENVTGLPVTKLVVIKYSNATGPINITDRVRFTINVTNNGPSNATWVEITDELIPAFEFVNATGNWTRTGSKITWIVPRLDNGTTASVDLIVQVIKDGKFENIAIAKSNENTTGATNGTNVTANPLVDLSVIKTVDKTEALVGENIVYTIYVINAGPSDATGVNVTDKLDQLLYFVSFDSNRTGITYDPNTGIAKVGNLRANETVILYITARVIDLGVIPNVVTVKSNETDTHPENNTYPCENVTAERRATPIRLDAVDIYYGDDEILNVTLPREATGTVNITVNGRPYNNVPINNGVATLPLIDLGGGDYHVEVIYGGNSEYVGNSTSGDFKVLPLTPTIRIEVVDIWHGEVEVLNVTVNAPGTVNITVYGMTITIPLDHQVRTTNVLMSPQDKLSYDGKATWILIGLPVGTYPAYAVYNGNENYTTVSTSDVFHVRDKPSTVVVTADDIHVGEDAVINIQVGPKGVTGNVTLIVEGKVYDLNIDENGRASITVSGLKAGLKHVYVKYNGDILYRVSENTTTFKVLKYKPPIKVISPDIKVGEDGKITVTVPEDATGTITIKVNGKTYTKPVRNGKAVFTVPGLEEGIHSIRAYYSGDDRYLSADTVGKIKVTQNDNGDKGTIGHEGKSAESTLQKHPTGNPIFMLIVIILALCTIPLRKFRK